MGPTIVLPGTQYHNTPSTYMASYVNFKSQIPLTVKAGSVAIVHYDIWHAWMPNRSNKARRMLKFLFDRVSQPTTPSWNAAPDFVFNPNPFTLPIDDQSAAYKHRVLWRSVWDWLHGIPQEARRVSGKEWSASSIDKTFLECTSYVRTIFSQWCSGLYRCMDGETAGQ